MIRSTSILTSLFVFTAALTANAQSHRGDHAGHDHSGHDHADHAGHGHNSPTSRTAIPSRTTLPLQSLTPYSNGSRPPVPGASPFQYTPPTPLGRQPQIWNDPTNRSPGCYGNQHNSARFGGASSPRSNCPDGNCSQRSHGLSQQFLAQPRSNFNRPYGSTIPSNYGAATTPYQNSPLQLNITKSPFLGLTSIPRSTTPSYQRQPTAAPYQGRFPIPASNRPFSQPATNNPFFN